MSTVKEGGDAHAASATTIRVRVRLFAIQRELAGTREIALDLRPEATVEDAWQALVSRFPVLAPGRPAVRFALNGVYADAGDRLAHGDEVACIPPVSGGAGDPAVDPQPGSGATRTAAAVASPAILEVREGPLDASVVVDLAARLSSDDDGAIVAFVGRTRRTPGTPAPGQEAEAARHAGRTVERLEYEAHESMAAAILAEIAGEIATRFGVTRLAIVHRLGEVPLGEASVAVVACAPHRDAAFDAARYAIDETKARAPIWKAERFADGHVWIGEPARMGPRQRNGGAAEPEP